MARRMILASASPRRKEILEGAGFDFEIITSDADETIGRADPAETGMTLSYRKAKAVYETLAGEENILVIGADTLVYVDEDRLGKPRNKKEEYEFLKKMSGRSHDVITGVTLLYDVDGVMTRKSFAQITKVNVASLSDAEMDEYAADDEWMDKAGGYAIQGKFAKFITGIEGEYASVMGFPIAEFYKVLKTLV